MLIKWVRCRVVDREAFHRGQLAWAGLRGLPGFHGQCGGWSRRDPDRAHVLGFWADEPHYRAFMAGEHDRLAAAQIGSYAELEVRLFDGPPAIGDYPSGDLKARLPDRPPAIGDRPPVIGDYPPVIGDYPSGDLEALLRLARHQLDAIAGEEVELEPAWTVPA